MLYRSAHSVGAIMEQLFQHMAVNWQRCKPKTPA
jgi:hypothetical protein